MGGIYKVKRICLITSILVLTFLVVGCSSMLQGEETADTSSSEAETAEAAEKKETNLGDYQVDLQGEIQEEEDQFIINGQSNLLPGSRIVGEVVVDEGETVYSDTSELVQEDGSFYMELEHHQYGEAEIVVRFDFESVQDDEIKRHYGDKGQNLEGPFIYKHETFDGIMKKAEAKISYEPNGQNDLTIKAPEWYDLPEDYGDPRVWIEVDEISEDGEFFYIHGRSNILEGSEIKVKYKNNRGSTRINPDGSFDLKFDYEYLEDQDIVITFEPSGFQWNEIEEAYGASGQKLVGNLVVQDRFNKDKQYIEKRIPWDKSAAESSNRGSKTVDGDEETDEELEDESDVSDREAEK